MLKCILVLVLLETHNRCYGDSSESDWRNRGFYRPPRNYPGQSQSPTAFGTRVAGDSQDSESQKPAGPSFSPSQSSFGSARNNQRAQSQNSFGTGTSFDQKFQNQNSNYNQSPDRQSPIQASHRQNSQSEASFGISPSQNYQNRNTFGGKNSGSLLGNDYESNSQNLNTFGTGNRQNNQNENAFGANHRQKPQTQNSFGSYTKNPQNQNAYGTSYSQNTQRQNTIGSSIGQNAFQFQNSKSSNLNIDSFGSSLAFPRGQSIHKGPEYLPPSDTGYGGFGRYNPSGDSQMGDNNGQWSLKSSQTDGLDSGSDQHENGIPAKAEKNEQNETLPGQTTAANKPDFDNKDSTLNSNQNDTTSEQMQNRNLTRPSIGYGHHHGSGGGSGQGSGYAGQSPVPSYGQSQGSGYGQSQGSGYGESQGSGYGRPSSGQGSFAQSGQGQFGFAYGKPSVPFTTTRPFTSPPRPPMDGGPIAGIGSEPVPLQEQFLAPVLQWHVGIYTKMDSPYSQICGGSLVKTDVVLTAAHCFWRDEAALRPALFAAAAGKLQRVWNASSDAYAQKSDIKEIHIPLRFRDVTTNFQDDIAIARLSTPFEYAPGVKPVCVDFDLTLEREQLRNGREGTVAGFGLTEKNGRPSEVLNYQRLPYVEISDCIAASDPDFLKYLTSDKICAGDQKSDSHLSTALRNYRTTANCNRWSKN